MGALGRAGAAKSGLGLAGTDAFGTVDGPGVTAAGLGGGLTGKLTKGGGGLLGDVATELALAEILDATTAAFGLTTRVRAAVQLPFEEATAGLTTGLAAVLLVFSGFFDVAAELGEASSCVDGNAAVLFASTLLSAAGGSEAVGDGRNSNPFLPGRGFQ